MAPQLFVPPARGSSTYLAAHRAGLIPQRLHVNFVDLKTKKIISGSKRGEDFDTVNPRGNAPTLLLDDGTMLNESGAIMQWIADQSPASGLLPPNGTRARYEAIAKLNYINSELQPCCEALMNEDLHPEVRSHFLHELKSKLIYVSDHLLPAGACYLQGERFTVADAKLYFVLGWLERCGVALPTYPLLRIYWDHIGILSFVKEAVRALDSQLASPNR